MPVVSTPPSPPRGHGIPAAAKRLTLAILGALTVWTPAAPASAVDRTTAPAAKDSTRTATRVYRLPRIIVRAERLDPELELLRLPGHASRVEISGLALETADLGDLLDGLAGVDVRRYGAFGGFSTVSIRGSSAAQVNVYLDGVPLTRAGAGVVNLADLPYAALERIEVYRGFAPPELPGAGMGGAIHLVTRAPEPSTSGGSAVQLHGGRTGVGAASQDTWRWNLSQQLTLGRWQGLLVGRLARSSGDFDFLDDNGTPLNPDDTRRVRRQNNWTHDTEVLAKLRRPFGRGGHVQLSNQLVRRRLGVPGPPSHQAQHARSGTTYDLTRLDVALPPGVGGRLAVTLRGFHDWRRDRFEDPASEVGLGFQDNRDVTRTLGAQVATHLLLPGPQEVDAFLEARRERFDPYRGFPTPARQGPVQRRTRLEWSLEHRLRLRPVGRRLDVHLGARGTHEDDAFEGNLTTPYSRQPARSDSRDFLEPRLGLSLRLPAGFGLEATYARYHRTPSFLELFGDGGSVAGSTDLVAETGIQRDLGVTYATRRAPWAVRASYAHFRKRADHLIVFLPQSQRTFVARNVGSARMQGHEAALEVGLGTARHQVRVEASYGFQDTEDLGVDIVWYAGKELPGRPRQKTTLRATALAGSFEASWRFEWIGRNFLDRWNRDVVTRRALHGIDLRAHAGRFDVQVGIQNLGDVQIADVAGFPVPGRTVAVGTSYRY